MASALLRVSRKRGADPHEALVLHNKRSKQAPPLVFTLYKAAAEQNDQDLEGLRCLDLPKPGDVRVPQEDRIDVEEEPLAFVGDDAAGLMGREDVAKRSKEPEQVMLNGKVMQAVEKNGTDDELVFDYYQLSARHRGVNWEVDLDALDVRFANGNEYRHEHDDDSDGPVPDDEDDSNDEDNWRNDYPDEDSYEENSDHEDAYGELVADNWHGGRFPNHDDLHLRLQNVAINDRYEAYFEGDDTNDEDENADF